MALRWILAAALLRRRPQSTSAQPTLEQRVQRMEDESAIRRMLIEYGAFLDAKDYRAYAALFAPDGVWQGGFGTFTGPAAIEAMLTANLGAPEAGFVSKSNFHMLTNPLIAIDGDRAHVRSKYLFWTASPDMRPTPLLAGRYVDEFVRVGGQWRIARRSTWGQIPFRDPNAPPAPGAGLRLHRRGRRATQRLRAVEDQLAIQRVLVEYSRADRCARLCRLCRACSRARATWQQRQYRAQGPGGDHATAGRAVRHAAARASSTARTITSCRTRRSTSHGDRATARSRHLLMMRGPDGSPVPELAGALRGRVHPRGRASGKILRRVDNPIMPTPGGVAEGDGGEAAGAGALINSD